MKKQFLSASLATVVLAVLLVLSMGEIAVGKATLSKETKSTTSLNETKESATYHSLNENFRLKNIFLKRAKKNNRFGKTFLHYDDAHYPKVIYSATVELGHYLFTFTRHSRLLLSLCCVLQI